MNASSEVNSRKQQNIKSHDRSEMVCFFFFFFLSVYFVCYFLFYFYVQWQTEVVFWWSRVTRFICWLLFFFPTHIYFSFIWKSHFFRHAWTVSGISSRFISLCGTCEVLVIKRVNEVLPAISSIACDMIFFFFVNCRLSYHSWIWRFWSVKQSLSKCWVSYVFSWPLNTALLWDVDSSSCCTLQGEFFNFWVQQKRWISFSLCHRTYPLGSSKRGKLYFHPAGKKAQLFCSARFSCNGLISAPNFLSLSSSN